MAAQEIGSLYIGLGFDTAVFDRQIITIPQQAQKAADGIKKGFQAAGQELDRFTKSSGATKAAVQNLSFQLNDIGTSLASGGSPFRVLAQQGGQVLQAFQQGGGFKKVFGEISTSLGNILTPARTAALGIVAVAGAFAVLTARAVENTGAMRQFGVMLKGLGLDGQATADGLEAAAKRLRDVGLNASDARAALSAATRAGISPGRAERVVRTGQNLVPVLGPDAPGQLTAALTAGSVEPLAKIVTQLRLVKAGEIEAAREAEKYGLQLSYIERWFGLIEQRAKGLNKEALSPLGQQLRDLGTAWSEMLDKMANTGPIKAAIAAMTDLARLLKAISEYKGAGEASSALAGAASGALAGRFFGPWGAAVGAFVGGVGGAYYGARTADGKVVADAAIPAVGAALSIDQLVKSVIQVESSGNPRAVSSAGARGLMQLMPGTAARYGVTDSFNPTENVRGGTAYLQDLLKRYDGNVEYALMAYNWGEGNLDKALKGLKEIPSGVRAYASKVMAGAGSAGGAGGSILAQPDRERLAFVAAQQGGFENQSAETSAEINAEKIRAGLFPGFRGPGGLTRAGFAADAALEARRSFGFRNDISTNPTADEQIGRRISQLTELGRARGRTALAQGGEADRQTTEQLQLQASLFGKSTTEIEKQVSLLKIRQQAEAAGLPLTDAAVKAREEEAKHLAETNDLLRQQQSLLSQMKEVAGVFENAFSSAFDAIGNGTFKLRTAIGGLVKDLAKTLASSAFKRLLGGDDTGGGLLGTIAGKLFGVAAAGGSGGQIDFGGGADIPAFAGGGSFQVGGSGGIDSQLVAFRATPGEMVDVSHGRGGSGGGAEIIRIDLNPNEGWVAGVADQRIVTRSGQIVDIAVKQSSRTVQRNFAGMSAEAQARQL